MMACKPQVVLGSSSLGLAGGSHLVSDPSYPANVSRNLTHRAESRLGYDQDVSRHLVASRHTLDISSQTGVQNPRVL